MRRIGTTTASHASSMLAMFFVFSNGVGHVIAQNSIADGHADHAHGAHDHAAHAHPAEPSAPGPNGGQTSIAGDFQFEVIYSANDIHLFVFDSRRQPVTLQGIRSEMLMRVKGVEQEFRVPLGFGQLKNAQLQVQDILGSKVDVSRVVDGSMQVTFELQGLPSRTSPSVRFEQTFAITRQATDTALPTAQTTSAAQPTVTVSQLTASDQAGVSRQKICPVMDTPLGDHGNPIKLIVGDQPLYVCCKGCIRKVQQDPQAFLAKSRQMSGLQ